MAKKQKIVIAELDIDIQALRSKQAERIKQINITRESQKKLRKDTENLTKATEDQLKTFVDTDSKLKKLNTEYGQSKSVLSEVETGVKDLSKALEKQNKNEEQAKKNNKELIKLRSQLNNTTKEGKAAIDQINVKLDQNNKVINANSSALEQQRLNIGNYGSALDRVIPGIGGFIGGLQGTLTGLKSATGGLKAFKIALIATGIGAIVAVIALLVKGFMSTQEGMDKVNRVLAQGSAVIKVIIGRIGQFALGLVNLLTGEWAKGAEQMKNAFTGIDKAIKDTIESAGKLADLIVINRRLNRESNILIATLEVLRGKYEQLRDDATRSFFVRENASKRLAKLEKEIADERVAITIRQMNEVTLANALIIASGNKLTAAEKDRFSEVVIAFKEAEAQKVAIELNVEKEARTLKQDRLEKDLDILIDGFDNQKTINERKIADEKLSFKQRKKILDETIKLSDDSFAKQIETLQKFTDARIDANDLLQTSDAVLLNEKIRSLGLSEIIEGRLLEVIRDRRTAEMDLAVAGADLQLEIVEDTCEKELEKLDEFERTKAAKAALKFREGKLELEEQGAGKTAILLLTLAEEERLAVEHARETIKDKQLLERTLTLIHDEYSEIRKQITRGEDLERLEGIAKLLDTTKELFNNVADSILGFSQNAVERGRHQTEQSIEDTNRKYDAQLKGAEGNADAMKKIELERESELNKIQTRQNAKELQHAKTQKRIAVIKSIINTALAVTKVLPNILAAIGVGIFGAAQTAIIAGQQLPRYHKGTKRVRGQGKEVPALLLEDERIVDVPNARKIGFDMSNDQLASASKMYRSFMHGHQGMTDKGIIGEIKALNKTLKNKPVSNTSVHVTEGYAAFNRTRYLS